MSMNRRRDKQSASRHGNSFWEEEKGGWAYQMLNKMGWEQGKGLGKNEQGSANYVKANLKQSLAGVGGEKKDEMISAAHSLFEDVLKKLNETHGSNDQGGEIQEEQKDDLSVSAAIQTHIARKGLYGKFKAAKDLNRYSGSAMSEIFGRKKEEEVVAVKKDPDVIEPSSVPVVTSSVSMQDYFAKKITSNTKKVTQFQAAAGGGFTYEQQEALYNQQMGISVSGRKGLGFGGGGAGPGMVSKSTAIDHDGYPETRSGGLGFSVNNILKPDHGAFAHWGKPVAFAAAKTPNTANGSNHSNVSTNGSNGSNGSTLSNGSNGSHAKVAEAIETEEPKKKKKKKDKTKEVEPAAVAAVAAVVEAVEEEGVKKKKKKKDTKEEKIEEISLKEGEEEPKKKKKKRDRERTEAEVVVAAEEEEPKKKKQKKEKREQTPEAITAPVTSPAEEEVPKKKKNKDKTKDAVVAEVAAVIEVVEEPKKKKKDKKKQETEAQGESVEVEAPKSKKKKREAEEVVEAEPVKKKKKSKVAE